MALLTALSMVALCLAGAFVLDLGLVRVDRQQNKSAADAAALAGVNAMVPDVNSDVFHPYTGVCQALSYLRLNRPALAHLTGTWSTGTGGHVDDGCAPALAVSTCDAATTDPSTWARFEGTTADGRVHVRIQGGYDVSDGGFAEEALPALQADPGAARYHGCDQLAVIIDQQRDTALGSFATSQVGSRIRSVGRADVQPPESPFALLILERTACDALAVASGGAGGRIDVLGLGTHPGMIHVDSVGGGSMCSSKPIVEGKNPGTCPDVSASAPTCGGIVAHESVSGGFPGRISVSATTNVSDGSPRVFAGPYPGTDPTYRDQITRSIVDDIYLQGVTDAVANEAKPAFAAAAAGSPAGLTDGPWATTDCSPDATALAATKVFVSCSNFTKDATFPNATDLIFTGKVSSGTLKMPNAVHVYVVGASPNGISVGTEFSMHDGGLACKDPAGATVEQRGRLFLKNGAFKDTGNGTFRACNTTMILMGGRSDACLPALASYVATYTDTPCGGTAGNGSLDMSGSGSIDWTAPSKVLDVEGADPTATDHHDLEDLALWDETYGTQNVGGGGYMHLSGTFSAPNATPFKLNGGSTQDVRDSQYVVRQLWSTGNGTLTMQPSASLPVKSPTISFSLVR